MLVKALVKALAMASVRVKVRAMVMVRVEDGGPEDGGPAYKRWVGDSPEEQSCTIMYPCYYLSKFGLETTRPSK
jgi:hypothetical protein